MNYDYLSDVDFDLMTEQEFLNYLDEKARRIREENVIRALPPYHTRLGAMVSRIAQGDKIEINENKTKKRWHKKTF